MIIKVHVIINTDTCISGCLICIWIHILIFYGSPEPFHEDIIVSATTVIHTDFWSGIQKNLCEFWARKMTSLIRIHDLRFGYLQCFVAGIQNKSYFHGVTQLPMQHKPWVPIDDCHQIKPICFDWYIGNVNGPNLIRMVDFKPFQQVRINFIGGSGLLVFCRGYMACMPISCICRRTALWLIR